MSKILWLLCLLLVAGCVHQQRFTPPPSLQAHQAQLAQLDLWQLQGKLGVRSPGDSGSASLIWDSAPASYRIYLSAPLGQKHVEISGNQQRVELRQSGQPTLTAKDAESLVRKALGWQLPVSQLNYWVRGVPAPQGKITQLQLTPEGLLDQLEQSGWQINYFNYRAQAYPGGDLPLPGKIVAQYRELRLTLVIRQWQLGRETSH